MIANRNRLLVYWTIAVGFQTGLAIVSAVYPSAFGYSEKFRVFDDVTTYFHAARPILEGRLPYRNYPVEYPILAIPLFVVPLTFGEHFESYKFTFAGEMLLINALAVWLVARSVEESDGIGKVPGRLAWYTVLFAVFCPMIVARFDLAPMVLAFFASRWLAKDRVKVGGIAAGLGVLVKLVPGLVIVPFLAKVGPWRPKASGLAWCLATVAVGGYAWVCLGGEGVARSFRYHGERGLEIGSTYATAYLIAHKVAGAWVFSHFDHGSMNITGPGSADAARLAPIVQGAMLALVASRARRMAPGEEIRLASAALLAYILPGKVLSPQYLIWLMPFLVALPGSVGKPARRVFLACVVLTTALYPHLFHALTYFETSAVGVLAARNLGLAWLFALLLRVWEDVDTVEAEGRHG